MILMDCPVKGQTLTGNFRTKKVRESTWNFKFKILRILKRNICWTTYLDIVFHLVQGLLNSLKIKITI